MSSTKLNLLYDVGFNREVGQNSALYWTKKNYNLAHLLEKTVNMTQTEIEELNKKSNERIKNDYSWELITRQYNKVFLEEKVH